MASRHNLKAWLTVALGGTLLLHAVLAWNSADLVRKGYPDFTIFYCAGKIVRDGLGPKMYDEATQYKVQQEFAAGVSIRKGPLPYNHPPFEALLFVPFTWLPYWLAFLLWDLIGLGILLGLPLLLRPHIPILLQLSLLQWLLASLAFFPVFIALLQGQDILLLGLLLALAFIALKKQNDLAAGCWLGLGLFRPHFIVPLLLVLLWQKRTKAVAGFLLVAAVLGVISVAIVGWQGALSYPDYVFRAEQTMADRKTVVPIGMPNLRGLVNVLLVPAVTARIADSIVVLLSVAMLLYAAWRWRKSGNFQLGFSLAVLSAVLTGYHAFAYDLSLLLVPIALVLDYCLKSEVPGAAKRWLLGPLVLLFLTPLQMFLSMRAERYSLMTVALLVWWWGMAREMRGDRVAAFG